MGFFSKTLQAAMPKMVGSPLNMATAIVSFALSVVKGQKPKKATKGKKKTTVRKSKIMSKKQQMEVIERICQSAYGTYIRGATTVAARYIGHPAAAIPASEMVKTMMDEVAPPIHKYHVVTPKEKKKIDIKEDALNIMLIFADSDLERKEKKTTVSFKNDTEWAMFNGFIRSVQYLNNKYHPEIRKASEELQQKKDNWIKESVEFARRVCIEYPEYATMTNKLLYNIPIDETKLNNEEKVELMLSGFVSGFIKDSALGLNGLADAAIYPIDTMEVLTSPDIASVAWDGMTRDIKADWKEGTIQGKSEAVGRTASVALPFLGVISKITKATGTAGKLTGTAAREAAERATQEAAERAAQEATERAAQEAAERAAQEAAERTAQETTERAGKEVSQEVAERARKTDNSIPVKRGDSGSGANGSGVKISGEKPKTDIDEVKNIGAEDKVNIDDITKKKADDENVTTEATTQVKAKMLKNEIQEIRNTIVDEKSAFERNLEAKLTDYGISLEEFNTLRVKDVATLTEAEKQLLKKLRDMSPKPTQDTLLQKIIPTNDIGKYLTGEYTTAGGFVTRFEDVAHLKTYDDIYYSLRLNYPGSAFLPESDEFMGAIRFKTEEASKISTAFNETMGGHVKGDPPFTGNGFTKSENGKIIPEFKCDDYLKISDGAQLVQIDKNGTERILAIYNKNIDGGRFIPIE